MRDDHHTCHLASTTATGAALAAGFEATCDFGRAVEADALSMCVPTPLNAYREPELSDLASVTLSAESIGGFDGVLLATSHGSFDYPLITRHAGLTADTRGVYLERLPNRVSA